MSGTAFSVALMSIKEAADQARAEERAKYEALLDEIRGALVEASDLRDFVFWLGEKLGVPFQ